FVAHHAHAAHRQQHRETLPDLVVPAAGFHFLDDDAVGFAQDLAARWRHLAENAHGKSRPREGLAINNFFGHTEFEPELPYFVLEQTLQRLDELELHFLRQTAHIVVAL